MITVEQRDSRIDRGVHHGRHVLIGHSSAEIIAAESDSGNGEAGESELLVGHLRGHADPGTYCWFGFCGPVSGGT